MDLEHSKVQFSVLPIAQYSKWPDLSVKSLAYDFVLYKAECTYSLTSWFNAYFTNLASLLAVLLNPNKSHKRPKPFIMSNNNTFFLLSFFLLSIFACTPESNNQKVVGNWQGASWKVKGEESGRNAADVLFEFNADNTYFAAFGQQKEEGTFRLVENKLYTTAEGKAEKMVQVSLYSIDTLVMDMNRVGILEQLILVKK